MPRADKVEKVEDLKARIEDSSALLLAEYRGLTVHDAGELRTQLRETDTRFMIVKNTLLKRAADEEGMGDLAPMLQGSTAVAFVKGDAVAAAKKITEAAKKFPALVLKGGWMEGRLLTAADAEALSKLESREAMLSKVAGMIKGEMNRAANMFQALQGQFLSLLEAYKEKVPGEEPAASEESSDPSAEAQEASAPEPPDSQETAAETPAAEAAETTVEAEAGAEAEAGPETEGESPAVEAAEDASAEAGPESSEDSSEEGTGTEVASEEASDAAPSEGEE